MKVYVCPRWPSYSIGKHIKFVEARFQTEDPELIRQIESNDWYRVFIWPADGVDYDQESEGRLPAPQQDDREADRTGEEVPGGRIDEGREEGAVLSELEELVQGSGIIESKGKKGKASAR